MTFIDQVIISRFLRNFFEERTMFPLEPTRVFPTGYYLMHGRDGRPTKQNRRADERTGRVIGQRNIYGAIVEWENGRRGSVLWDWIDDSQQAEGREIRSKLGALGAMAGKRAKPSRRVGKTGNLFGPTRSLSWS